MTHGNSSKYSTMCVTLNTALLEKMNKKYETTNKSNSTSSNDHQMYIVE